MLEKNSSIETLYMDLNKIGDKGGHGLAKCISKNSKLSLIYINDNEIKDFVKISHALEGNKVIISLYIYNNHLTNEIKKLVKKKHYD